jgi:hypothetical protein
MQLNEGLRQDDLEGLVLSVLSIDEYESKIDDSAIVVGFFVQYQDPANDLNRFIQKSAIDIIDTEVSPAPTEDGYYVVFLELQRDIAFIGKMMQLLGNLENLVKIKSWSFTTIGHNKKIELTGKNLKSYVNLNVSEPDKSVDVDGDTDQKQNESIVDFLQLSLAPAFSIKNDRLTLIKENKKYTYDIIAFGPTLKISERFLASRKQQLKENAHQVGQQLMSLFGAHCTITHRRNFVAVSNSLSQSTLLLKN